MKKELRTELRARLAALTPQQIAERSARACNLLLGQPEYARAESIMIYLSMPQEVDTAAIAVRAWEDLKRVLAPRVAWEQRRMHPVEIHSLASSTTEQDGVGIRQPPSDGQVLPVSEIDLIIVPGLGFDESGNRLGRGRGFYDRFLGHRDFRGIACALAFEEQVLPQVPSEALDVKVDMLVTDVRVRRFARQRAARL
jgi:5-formyltetrahydrofolate cyclo-ligase